MQKLPKKSELPHFIQDFLTDIKDMSDLEKIKEIHNFTLENVDYIDQGCGDTLSPKTFFKNDKILGDCDDYAFFNASLMHYAGLKDVGLFGGIVKNTFPDGSTDSGGHAVAVTKIDGNIYVLDQNYISPMIMKNGKALGDTRLSDEGGKNETGVAALPEFERAALFVEFGNNKKIYVWEHPDDDTAYETPDCSSQQLNDGITNPLKTAPLPATLGSR